MSAQASEARAARMRLAPGAGERGPVRLERNVIEVSPPGLGAAPHAQSRPHGLIGITHLYEQESS